MRVSSLELTTVRHVLGFLVERTVEEIILSKTKVSSLDCDLAGKNRDVADCLQSSADQRRAGQHRETSRYTFPFSP